MNPVYFFKYPNTLYFVLLACGWILSGVALGMLPIWFTHAVYIAEGSTFSEVSPLFILKRWEVSKSKSK